MSLGSKISKLRKELNYTQEELAVKLDVTRQSVSKWESDLSYPDTDKLILLSNLFDVSLDYLLKGNDNIEKPKQDIKIYHKKEFFTFIYSLIFSLLMLIFFNFKVARLPVNINDPFGGEYYMSFNMYNFLHNITLLGNFLVFISLLAVITVGVTGSLILFTDKKKVLYLIRNISSLVLCVSLFIFILVIISYTLTGLWLLFILSLFNILFLTLYNKNKFKYLE